MAKINIKTKDIDRGWRGIVRQAGRLDKTFVQVGLQAGDKAHERVVKDGIESVVESDKDVALIAAWNEFGTKNIPERPFMRNAWDKNEDELYKRIKAEWAAITAGKKTAEHSLELLGAWHQNKIQMEIVNGDYVANAPNTVARKGSSRPLIDTGRMRQSIRYVIKQGGGA